ncbi:MAG: hypothetical protein HPY85_00135 [Anaerolineae bacterium]|nr:hypothetical protein [Anaerolineae bacterium]
MNLNEILPLLIRNTLFSWLINVEFVAPLLIILIARKNRKYHPVLTRKLWLPAVLIWLAGLAKEAYLQFLFPYSIFTNQLALNDITYKIQLVFYTILFSAGVLGLAHAIFLRRQITPPPDFLNE